MGVPLLYGRPVNPDANNLGNLKITIPQNTLISLLQGVGLA